MGMCDGLVDTATGVSGRDRQSEECLVLNVWTACVNGSGKRPVLLWCHGGGFVSLSGSSPQYDGAQLCRQGDVVVVTINHRLNVFGFLHLGDLAGAEFAESGNVGMLDIVASLEWVRDNIAVFGGDAGNVTVFGGSGGGRKISTLLAMPSARGLFHRAIIQSGPGLHMQPRDSATALASALMKELGVNPHRIRVLQSLPATHLLDAFARLTRRSDSQARIKGVYSQRGFGPTVDGSTLPAFPFDPVAPSLTSDIPLLIGTNTHEMALFLRHDPQILFRTLTFNELTTRVRLMAGNAADHAVACYRELHSRLSPAEIFILMTTDRTYRLDSVVLAQRKAALGKASVFMYQFDWKTPVNSGRLLSHHGLELTFVFDNVKSVPKPTGGGSSASALARIVSGAWVAFARTGSPNTEALPKWDNYTHATRRTMFFDDNCYVCSDPGSEERGVWQCA
jgi:para-nitrobenzyl esterase